MADEKLEIARPETLFSYQDQGIEEIRERQIKRTIILPRFLVEKWRAAMKTFGDHFKVQCSECGRIIAQCKCPSADKATKYTLCPECLGGNSAADNKSKQGWECPKCGMIWAPSVKSCENCNNTNVRIRNVPLKEIFDAMDDG